jgi:hypothetical protein
MALAVRTRSYTNMAASISLCDAALLRITARRRSKASVPSLIFALGMDSSLLKANILTQHPTNPHAAGQESLMSTAKDSHYGLRISPAPRKVAA